MLATTAVWLLGGCVFRYGQPVEAAAEAEPGAEGAPAAQTVDFALYTRTFDELIAADSGDDADRRDRLDAARDLSRQLNRGRTPPEQAIAAYLDRVAAIESRATPQVAPALVPEGGGDIGEEPLDADSPRGRGTPEPEPLPPEEALAAAKDALAANDYRGALDVLSPLKDSDSWPLLEEVWQEAVDGWVFTERERAGELYRGSRAWPTEARDRATQEVAAILEGLLEEYPETTYKAALVRNLQLVQRELPAASP